MGCIQRACKPNISVYTFFFTPKSPKGDLVSEKP